MHHALHCRRFLQAVSKADAEMTPGTWDDAASDMSDGLDCSFESLDGGALLDQVMHRCPAPDLLDM